MGYKTVLNVKLCIRGQRHALPTQCINACPSHTQNMLSRNKQPSPVYSYDTTSKSGASFTCTVVFNSNLDSHQTTGHGLTKKSSKHDASKRIYRMLTDHIDQLPSISPLVVSLHYYHILLVSLLQQYHIIIAAVSYHY